MTTMRRRESSQRRSVASTPESQPPGPTTFQRNRSVATSNPSFYESPQQTIHQSTLSSERNTSYYANYNGGNLLNCRKESRFNLWKVLPALILMILPWIPRQQTQWKIASQRAEIHALITEQHGFVKNLDTTTEQIRTLKHGVEVFTKENEASFQELHGGTTTPDLENEQYMEVEKAEEVFVQRIDGLEKHIQKTSTKLVQQRYER
jgi:hypothetical protein